MIYSILNPNWVFIHQLSQAIKLQKKYIKGVVLDIGCGEKPYLQLFKAKVTRYVGIDLPRSPLAKNNTVDVYANGTVLPFKDGVFDTVICFEVLDDIPEPSFLLAEIQRVIKPSGYLVLTVPQMMHLHNRPYDFYRFTPYGLKYLAEKHQFVPEVVNGIGGFWARIGMKYANFTIKFGRVIWLRRIIQYLNVIPQLVFLLIDRICFNERDVIGNILVAYKKNEEKYKKSASKNN